MQKLQFYIKDLLLQHDCVIIPQFGGFVSNYKSAFYDQDSGLFYPPCKEISFNSKLTHNDGLLCQQLMKRESKSFNQALENILNEVNVTKQTLKHKEVVLDGLGVLEINTAGFISFEPEKENKLFKSAYGLATFRFPELKSEDKNTNLRIVKGKTHNKSSAITSLSRYVAVAAAAFILFFFLFPTAVNDVRMNEANVITSFDTLNKTHSVKSDNQSAVNEHVQNEDSFSEVGEELAEAVIETNTSPTTTAIKQENKVETVIKNSMQVVQATQYHIIIASLATKKQAETFVKKHCEGVFPDYSIIISNGRYRISINALSDKNVAVPVLETFRVTNPEYTDAWLLTIKATV